MLWLAWLCRRILPIAFGITAVETVNYLQGKPPLTYFSAGTWLIIVGFIYAIFSASFPFASKQRRGPLDKWFGFIFGVAFTLLGMMVGVTQLILNKVNLTPGPSLLGRMARWHSEHPVAESLGWASAVMALGFSIIAAVEPLPNWRNGPNVISVKGAPPEWARPKLSAPDPVCVPASNNIEPTRENKIVKPQSIIERRGPKKSKYRRKNTRNRRR